MRHEFTDTAGRTWQIEVNVTTISRVRKTLDVNILDLAEPKSALIEQINDVVLLADVLYVLCRDQAEKLGVSDEQFGRALDEESLAAGFDAMLDGLVDFFQKSRRDLYRKVLSKGRAILSRKQQEAATAIASPEVDRMLDETIEKAMAEQEKVSATAASGDAGSSPASPESSPMEERSGN